jgi:hypothetical protein
MLEILAKYLAIDAEVRKLKSERPSNTWPDNHACFWSAREEKAKLQKEFDTELRKAIQDAMANPS